MICFGALCSVGGDPAGGKAPASGPAGADEIAAAAIKGFAAAEAKIGPDGYSRSTDAANLAWGESYVLMAYLAMWEGTGEAKYLDRFLEHTDRVLANRDDRRKVTDQVRKKVMPSWSTGRYSGGKRYAWVVHAGMITYPMARWVYLAKRDGALRKTHADRIARYEKDLAETVAAFDGSWRDGPGDGEGHYYGQYLRKRLPLNQQNAMGRTLVAMYLATGQAKCRRRAEKLARFFNNRIRKTPQKYAWSYWGGGSGVEDFSHAAINADFAFACCRAGIGFDAEDMKAFARTFAGRISPKGSLAKMRHAPQAGRWLHLAFFDPRLRRMCCEYYKDRWATTGTAGLVAAAYLVETARPFKPEKPISPKQPARR